ncbi:MAG: hypothetical protein AAGA23_05765 [Pseudomonadota bacterium]
MTNDWLGGGAGRRALPLLLAAVALGLSGCGSQEPAEARLRGVISTMEEAAESGRRDDFMDFVDENFGGQGSRLNRESLNDMLRIQLFRHSRVTATITDLEIQMFETRAEVQMKVFLTGGPQGWLPDRADFLTVTSGWKDTDDGWRLISADWQ